MNPAFPLGASISVAGLSADPYPLFRQLRAVEPVTWAPALGQWLVTSRDLAMEILRDPVRFRTDADRSPIRDTFGPQMLSTEGEQQRRYKSACAPPFNARAVQDQRSLVTAIVRARANDLRAEVSSELRRNYAAPIALETVARVIGLSPENDNLLREWYDTFADALANYAGTPETRVRAGAAVLAFRASIAPLLASPNADERSLLAELARAYPRLLDDDEIGSNALIVLFGGIETTEAAIVNAVWAMLTHPATQARARDNDADLARCLEESLRWEPAVQTCTRYAFGDCEIGGVRIPDGALVQCMIGAMNRDPDHYANPDDYDPWRAETTPHTAFGFGRHFCLGAALARLEAMEALGQLLRGFPRLRLDLERTDRPSGHEFRKPDRITTWLS